MLTICTLIPTLTTTRTFSSTTEIITFTETTISIPGNVTTSAITDPCDVTVVPVTGTPLTTPTCVPITREIIITGTGGQSVLQVPITSTETNLSSATFTLFSSSCTVSSSSSSSTTSATPSITTSTTPRTTESLAANTTVPTTSSPATLVSDHSDGGAREKIAPILGGTLGGVILLAVIVWLALRYLIKPSARFKPTGSGRSTKEHKVDLLEDDDSDYGRPGIQGYNYQRYQDSPRQQYQHFGWDPPGHIGEAQDATIDEHSAMQPLRPVSGPYPYSPSPLSPLAPAINHHRFSDPPEESIFPGQASMGQCYPASQVTSQTMHQDIYSPIGQRR